MTDASHALYHELVESGLPASEARWLIEEFGSGGDDAAALRHAAARRLAGEPLQYVIGHWPFHGLDLDVDPRVLIPRPESEELVDHALAALALRHVAAPLVVDFGCGSGAIGLALVSELGTRGVVATLVAVDESDDALTVARRNARKHDLTAVSFVRSSWFDDLDASLRGRIDLIVANPPYVGSEEFATLDPVLRHEPEGALIAPDRDGVAGFDDVATIIEHAPSWLAPGGVLALEHGNEQGAAVVEAARAAGFRDVADHRDLAGWPRVLVAQW